MEITRQDFCDTLWPALVARYQEKPGLQQTCLQMQDQHGADIVLALMLYCADRAGLSPVTADWRALDALVRDWRINAVQPLRGVRRWLKQEALTPAESALREQIKALELGAERLELARLSARFARFTAVDPARASAAAYLTDCGVGADLQASFLTP